MDVKNKDLSERKRERERERERERTIRRRDGNIDAR